MARDTVKIGGMAETVSVAEAARLMDVTSRWIRKLVESGKLQATQTLSVLGGGSGGTAYRIQVSSMPADAQIQYFQQSAIAETGNGCRDFDLAGYRERKGEDGIRELLTRQRAALAAHGMRLRYEQLGRGYMDRLDEMARALGIATGTLYRWERAYAAEGLAGIARPTRADKGQSRSMCYLARDYLEFLMCDAARPTQEQVMRKCREAARESGETACENCPYRNATAARIDLEAEGGALPMCSQPGEGMIPPESRHAVNRAIDLIPKSVLAYARYGKRYWDANFLQKVVREKPKKTNEVWFGDHHEMNVWVLDRRGKAVRPWLTAWMDACSGVFTGWMLTLDPNSDTIAESFEKAVLPTVGSPFVGLPVTVYVDNGKDYRSHRFEGSIETECSLGELNTDFDGLSMLQCLGVEARHALPFWAWTKPIERAFGTLDGYTQDMPGWCGRNASERREDMPQIVASGKLLTFEQFAHEFRDKVLAGYHNHLCKDDGLSPLQKYERAERARTDDPNQATMAMYKSMQCSRTVQTRGITLDRALYQDAALKDLVGEEVRVLYNRGYNDSVSIFFGGKYICEAERAATMQMVERDEEKVRAVMEIKGRQRKDVTRRITQIEQSVKGVHREAYTEAVDADRDKSMARIGSLEALKRQKAKEKIVERVKRRKGELHEGERAMDDKFKAMGRAFMKREVIEG